MELQTIEAKDREIRTRIEGLRRTSETNVENFFRTHLEFVGAAAESVSEIIAATKNGTVLDLLIGTPFGIEITAHLTPQQKLGKTAKEKLLAGLRDTVPNIAAECKKEPRGRQAIGTLVMLLHAGLLGLSDLKPPSDQQLGLLIRWHAFLIETSEILARYESELAGK